MSDHAPLRRAFDLQAAACRAFGSPFSGDLLEFAAADIAADGAVLSLLRPWAGADIRTLVADAVPLRLLAGLHHLVLSGAAPALAAVYPRSGQEGDGRAAWAMARGRLATDAAALTRFMAHEPQTNEVRRSVCLLPGFLTVAEATGLPLRCFELGASAGLNQLWDRYHYRLGDAGDWGDPEAALHIDTDWRGAPPPLGGATVIERGACDRKPVRLGNHEARLRLRAYVWADQAERLRRLDGAVAAALAAGTRVEAADAVDWTRRRVVPAPGAATVLFHSVFWWYMPSESQAALTKIVRDLGERGTAAAPFAWLRMEPPPDNKAIMELRLTLWPGGEDRRLALVHPHGAWVRWT